MTRHPRPNTFQNFDHDSINYRPMSARPDTARTLRPDSSPNSFDQVMDALSGMSVHGSRNSISSVPLRENSILPPGRIAAVDTLYNEWVRNTPWEAAQNMMAARGMSLEGMSARVRSGTGSAPANGMGGSSGPEPLSPEKYTKPFTDFLTENPTVFHAVSYFADKLENAGYTRLNERDSWSAAVKPGAKLYVERNGSSLIAFEVGKSYKAGDGIAMIAGHVDALTAKLKPVSKKKNQAGYVQLGVAQYGGALNSTWWDRDLGIGGRVLVKDPQTGKVRSELVKLDYPIARIPSLAPHFGVGMLGQNNPETQAVPVIAIDNSDLTLGVSTNEEVGVNLLPASFASTQPPGLVAAIAQSANLDANDIVNWELELFDTQPAQVGGLNKDFIFGGRIDDKLCSWAAVEAFLAAPSPDRHINLVALFDDEEIGSLLRQGARGNFLPGTIERITEAFTDAGREKDTLSRTYANSFLVSADVTHAVNPNFLPNYLDQHAPRLNVGVVVSADSNGHMTTDAVSTAFISRVAELAGAKLQVFQIRNDSRSGGTVGPMLSAAMGCRAVDVGIPQLSMHSIRATTGASDPGLGVKLFWGVYRYFGTVGGEFDF